MSVQTQNLGAGLDGNVWRVVKSRAAVRLRLAEGGWRMRLS